MSKATDRSKRSASIIKLSLGMIKMQYCIKCGGLLMEIMLYTPFDSFYLVSRIATSFFSTTFEIKDMFETTKKTSFDNLGLNFSLSVKTLTRTLLSYFGMYTGELAVIAMRRSCSAKLPLPLCVALATCCLSHTMYNNKAMN